MIKNTGTLDRTIRFAISVVFAILIFTGIVKGAGIVILGVIGFFLLLTAVFGFCPLYTIVGLHTLRTKSGPDV